MTGSGGSKNQDIQNSSDEFDLSFKVFHELMEKRVGEILLVSSPYDAFIMEEDGRLAERITREYRGLNLTRPPRITWVSSANDALLALAEKKFDLVITMPLRDDRDPYGLSKRIRKKYKDLPVVLLSHDTRLLFEDVYHPETVSLSELYIWNGNTDLLLALIKNVEDQMNVAYDTGRAMVRVIILVEDSPKYRSSLLPMLYREIVLQTQSVMDDSLNAEHRILRMRARPKILVAENYEEAERLYEQYKPYLLGVFSDVRFQKDGVVQDDAGFILLEKIRKDKPGLPLLVLSSDDGNREKAMAVPAVFINKTSPVLHTEIRSFFVQYLAFGDFIFRFPDGREVARAGNLKQMEELIPMIPDASVAYHAERDHFSTWLMARSEIQLASKLQPIKSSDFSNVYEIKKYLVAAIRERRKGRQKGVVTDFVADGFDPDMEFVKIGSGSLGGKGRGLAFVSTLLKQNRTFNEKFPNIKISIPRTLVISTEGFDAFITENNLKDCTDCKLDDSLLTERFLNANLPDWLLDDLDIFLAGISYPLAVRSSSLLEDSQFQPFAGIYKTYMIPNNDPDPAVRREHLIRAIKLVYASTFFEAPRSFSKSTIHRTEEEKMAVIIQEIVGTGYGGYYFPTLSGVAQSYNFYPVSYMKPGEGIAHIAIGLGKTVVEGGKALRFSPKYPEFLPQFSTVDDILKNAQQDFFALKMSGVPECFGLSDTEDGEMSDVSTLEKLDIEKLAQITDADAPVRRLISTYMPEDHRIRDSYQPDGHHLPTFAGMLKYKSFPLPEILSEILEMGRKGMGAPVEIEFAVTLPLETPETPDEDDGDPAIPEFALLQIRPMVINRQSMTVTITENERKTHLCYSEKAMGNGIICDISDVLLVKPDAFDPSQTMAIASEIGMLNKIFVGDKRKYLLIGPGRWGSADRWLGIPVDWNDISGVGGIIETSTEKLNADPSQGTHFFHNISSQGICYITVRKKSADDIDMDFLTSLEAEKETVFLKHIHFKNPLTIKIDGRTSKGVVLL